MTAHIKRMSSAQAPGTVMADEPGCAEPETALSTGSAAIASNAENHTAKRVLEFRRPVTRSRIQANRPMAIPSITPFSMRSADNWASWFNCVIYLVSPVLWLRLFQQLAQALQFFGVDATVF